MAGVAAEGSREESLTEREVGSWSSNIDVSILSVSRFSESEPLVSVKERRERRGTERTVMGQLRQRHFRRRLQMRELSRIVMAGSSVKLLAEAGNMTVRVFQSIGEAKGAITRLGKTTALRVCFAP